jgi:hypothetical protein
MKGSYQKVGGCHLAGEGKPAPTARAGNLGKVWPWGNRPVAMPRGVLAQHHAHWGTLPQ